MSRKKFRGSNRGRGRGRGGGGGNRNNWGPRADYQEVDKHHELFERYYNELGVVPAEEQQDFWAAMRRELPNSFRFAGSKGHALAVQQRLIDHYIPEITSVKYDGDYVEPPRAVEWFPEKLAWSMTTPKNVVRKFPPFASFQKFLVSETSVGNISRQEIVSMIPPLLMDVRPGMTVLDLCAAPGSKSAQLIEMVHGGEEARVRKVIHEVTDGQDSEPSADGIVTELEQSQASSEDDWSDDGRATGLLIANDVEYRRAQMLVHQVKRLNSPNIIVTNHDASQYPSIRVPSDGAPKYLKFDRILADVPCSGDGTCRKNPNVWRDWIPGNGLGLHTMQTRILVRALQMLKVGGRVVYSTCSLNPVENEAVVSAAIDRCGGNSKVQVIDCTDQLPGLKRSPGFTKWKIMDKQGRIWSSWSEVQDAKATEGEEGFARLVEGMFPPDDVTEDTQIPLGRCLRVYPHFQDTGGFFIAVLEKLSEIKARPEGEGRSKPTITTPKALNDQAKAINGQTASSTPENIESAGSPRKRAHEDENEPSEVILKKARTNDTIEEALSSTDVRSETGQAVTDSIPADQLRALEGIQPPTLDQGTPRNEYSGPNMKKKSNQPHEEPYKYLAPNHPELLKIYDFYQISTRFPRDRFMVRNATGEPVKAIYYTSIRVRDILSLNEGKGMKFVQCGVKMFMKQDAQGQDICRWRIQSEGIPILEPWVGEERIVRLYKKPTLKKLLIEMFPKVAGGGWKDLGEIGERVRDIGMGCCVLRVEPSEDEDGFRERIVLPLWRSISSLNLMLPKEERKAMLLRLYNDDSELIDHSKNRNRDPNQNGTKTEASNEKAAAAVLDLEAHQDDNTIADGNDVSMEDCGVDAGRENKTEVDQTNEMMMS